jgi:hypothetical protein
MAYEFTNNEFELEPEASSARRGGPPRKNTAAGILDPPFPAKRPAARVPLIFRILAVLLLAGLAVATFLLLFARH